MLGLDGGVFASDLVPTITHSQACSANCVMVKAHATTHEIFIGLSFMAFQLPTAASHCRTDCRSGY